MKRFLLSLVIIIGFSPILWAASISQRDTQLATSFISNGSNCSTGSFPLGVDASGNSESCTSITNTQIASFGITVDGGGSAITTGVKGYIQVPFACTINSNTVLLDQSGSIVFDVWKDTYTNYPPTVADTITASAKPTVSSATKSTDSTLTGWTTSITAGDILGFNVDSITTATRAHLVIKCTKT